MTGPGTRKRASGKHHTHIVLVMPRKLPGLCRKASVCGHTPDINCSPKISSGLSPARPSQVRAKGPVRAPNQQLSPVPSSDRLRALTKRTITSRQANTKHKKKEKRARQKRRDKHGEREQADRQAGRQAGMFAMYMSHLNPKPPPPHPRKAKSSLSSEQAVTAMVVV